MCDTLQLNWKLGACQAGNSSAHRQVNKSKMGAKKGSSKSSDKSYTLRACSIQKRMETETRKRQPKKRGPKPRPKSAPMSKYRRKTANQRERMRMGEINVGFELLREKIPSPIMAKSEAGHVSASKNRCEKMTKINILHVAINYIRALENILHTGDAGYNSYGTAIVQSPFMPTGGDQEASDLVTIVTKVEGDQEMVVEQQQPVTSRPQVVTKVLQPLNNVQQQQPGVNNVNKQPVLSPRNVRGLKVLHPQVQNKGQQGGTVLHQQPVVTRPHVHKQEVTRPLLVTNMLNSLVTMSKNLEDETFSGSEDSGIADNEEVAGLDCPDWTELTSTLDFPKRSSLDTMLSDQIRNVTSSVTSSSVVTSSTHPLFVARQVSFPELDSDPGADLFGDILCGGDEDGAVARCDHGSVGKGMEMGTSLFDISDNFPLMI